jgi:hypothetical protein
MNQVIDIITETYDWMIGVVTQGGPKILAAAIIVVVGVLLARVIKAGLHHTLRLIKFESVATRLGMTGALQRADVKLTSSDVICTLVYWTCLVFTLLATLGALGIAGSAAMTSVLDTIPKVVLAAAIVILGFNVSAFLAKLAQAAAVNAEIRQARMVRNVMHFGLCLLVVMLALEPFAIPAQFLGMAFLILFGGVCLSLALAFGLGSRDLAGNLARSKWQEEQDQSRALSDASQLGNEVFPNTNSSRQPKEKSKTRNLAA